MDDAGRAPADGSWKGNLAGLYGRAGETAYTGLTTEHVAPKFETSVETSGRATAATTSPCSAFRMNLSKHSMLDSF